LTENTNENATLAERLIAYGDAGATLEIPPELLESGSPLEHAKRVYLAGPRLSDVARLHLDQQDLIRG